MFNNIAEAEKAVKNGELDIKDFDSLKVYFQAVEEPAEDVYALDDWCIDEDENCDLITYHDPVKITRKEVFQRYSERDLHGFTDLTHCDIIDCHGHILTENEIREIFWNMGN